MNFKNNYIFNQLKHNPRHYIKKLIPDDILFILLWYFVSKESYLQRNPCYDKIFGGKSSPYDYFFLLFLYKTLSLDELIIFKNNMIDLDNYVDSLSASDLHKNLLYIHANGVTSFMSFFEKIRNSIAHGTFNLSNRFFMIGQKSSKLTSVMNFYFQINNEFESKLKEVLELLVENMDEDKLCKKTLELFENVEKRNDGFYYRTKKIIIAHNFKFQPVKEKGSQDSQIINLVNHNNFENVIIILCCPSNSKFQKEELISKKVEVISYLNILSLFECNIQY